MTVRLGQKCPVRYICHALTTKQRADALSVRAFSRQPCSPWWRNQTTFTRAHEGTSHRHTKTTADGCNIIKTQLRWSSSVSPSDNATDKSLPSHAANQRWQMSKRMQTTMDGLLSKAETASRRLNNYTGTDYTGIEALRKAIIDQEKHVTASHVAVAQAKEEHAAALSQQSSSQKEVVGLLERKASWTASDLERYMALIRSEHINDQAVQRAQAAVVESERRLEDARSELEKKERRQYHEEQIWSDTIRRNSTWVTFGLMGLNIVLLLVNLVIVEPWRRRRMVKEFRSAMDEKTIANPDLFAGRSGVTTPASTGPDGDTLRVPDTAVAKDEVEVLQVTDHPEETSVTLFESSPSTPSTLPSVDGSDKQSFTDRWESYRIAFDDLFSQRYVTLRRVDVTTVALQGAASGVAVMGLLFLLMRPH